MEKNIQKLKQNNEDTGVNGVEIFSIILSMGVFLKLYWDAHARKVQ